MGAKRVFPVLAAALAAGAVSVAAPAAPMIEGPIIKAPLDAITTSDDVQVACTGIGLAARSDPRWKPFQVKLEFAAPSGDYLSDEIVSVSRAGEHLVSVSCEGPWVLLKLPPGHYDIAARLNGSSAHTRGMSLNLRGAGHVGFIFRFPDA